MKSKEVWIGWVSSSVEAYNFTIYSFTAPLITKLIFHDEAWSSVFFSYFLLFIASTFLYPLGSFYYGLIGDKKGRQHTCIYSTLGLGLATGLMGLIPVTSYAWICFLILIGAQNFFCGGEYYGSIVFSIEHAQKKQTGLLSGLSCLFAVFGIVLANGLATLAGLMDNLLGIQICFFVGGIGGIVSYVLKNYCQETPEFIKIARNPFEKVNILDFIKKNWRKLGNVLGVYTFFIISYSFIFVFLPLVHFDYEGTGVFDTFRSLIMYGIALVTAGWLADRIGLEKVMLLGISSFAILIVPLCYFCKNLALMQIILTILASLTIGPIHGWMVSQFDVKERCRGIFISSAIATSIFGGSTVPLCMLIYENSASVAMCALYPLLIGLSAWGCLVRLKQKQKVLV